MLTAWLVLAATMLAGSNAIGRGRHLWTWNDTTFGWLHMTRVSLFGLKFTEIHATAFPIVQFSLHPIWFAVSVLVVSSYPAYAIYRHFGNQLAD